MISLYNNFYCLADSSHLLPSLEQFIHKILWNQNRISKGVPVSVISMTSTPLQLNPYDIVYIQNYLLRSFHNSSSFTPPWRHHFILLSDILSGLNNFYLRRAQFMHPKIFYHYLITLISVIQTFQPANEFSAYLAYAKFQEESSCCHLRRVSPTLKLELVCKPLTCVFSGLPKFTQIQIIQANNLK